MFDGSAVQEVEFEADEIDVFSELGINSNTKQNDTFNDPLMSLIETEDDDSGINETEEEIVEVEALEIPEVEPVEIEEQRESKFNRLDSRLKAGFLKEIIAQKLEDNSKNEIKNMLEQKPTYVVCSNFTHECNDLIGYIEVDTSEMNNGEALHYYQKEKSLKIFLREN